MAATEKKFAEPVAPRETLTIVSAAPANLRQPEELVRPSSPAEQAYRALHLGFVALVIVAGIDKFANVLTDWGQYLAPSIPGALGVSGGAFMLGVGALELTLGIGLLFKPRLGADLFSAYCLAIVVNLVIQGAHYDVALFDFALSAGACALARLASARERGALDEAPSDLGRLEYPRRARKR